MLSLQDKEYQEIAIYFCDLIREREQAKEELDYTLIPGWWERHFGTYSCKKNKTFPFIGSADCHIPFAAFADTMLEGRFTNGLLGEAHNSQFCKVGVRESSEPEAAEAAKKAEECVNEKIEQDMDGYTLLRSAFQGTIVEGVRFIKTLPVRKVRKYLKYKEKETFVDKLLKKAGYAVNERKELIKELKEDIQVKYEWEEVELRNMKWDKDATRLQDCKWIAQRLYPDKFSLKDKKKNEGWINTEALFTDTRDVEHLDVVKDYQGEQVGTDIIKGNTRFYEVWGEYSLDNENVESFQIVLEVSSRKLLYVDVNPFFDKRKPYSVLPCYKVSKRIEGQGNPQRISILNDELDTTHNITIDNGTLCNAFTYLYVPYKGFDPDKIKITVGGGIPVQHLDNTLKQLKLGNPSLDMYRLESFLVSLLEKMTLVSDYSLGREQEGIDRPTARGTLALIQQMSIGLNHILLNVQKGMQDAIKQLIDCMYEFMPAKGIVYGDGKVLKREDLEFREDFKINVLGDVIRRIQDLDKQIATIMLNAFAQDQTGEVNTFEVKKNFVEKHDPQLAKKIIRTPKEIQQIQEIMAVLAQKEQELIKREQGLDVEEGRRKEDSMVEEMRKEGIPEEEIQKRRGEFMERYLDKKEAERGGAK